MPARKVAWAHAHTKLHCAIVVEVKCPPGLAYASTSGANEVDQDAQFKSSVIKLVAPRSFAFNRSLNFCRITRPCGFWQLAKEFVECRLQGR